MHAENLRRRRTNAIILSLPTKVKRRTSPAPRRRVHIRMVESTEAVDLAAWADAYIGDVLRLEGLTLPTTIAHVG